ncbi:MULTISPECIES: type VI secretion system baseplate subunit TssE [Caldimonas]|uniref:type VI secretion system baseplate subunit TssE n=1 Tax=Caldimonas TaxID=196013 RepID=UPI00035D39D4|nr:MULTISPECIES: type VI secretion system baseplate subunit TssE [Caldimonas]GIX25778.1 MAG: hypothetical protein KatS3mg122_3009 [Caldimonas sp.]
MLRYRPSLLDCLLDDDGGSVSPHAVLQMSLEQIKDCVARDLEALLNTRCALADEDFEGYPLSERSVLSYGMLDFSSLSLASPEDRRRICQSIERAIGIHEPRLSAVQVTLETGAVAEQKLHFSIRAWLLVEQSKEPVSFDAVVSQTTQHYRVRCAGADRIVEV